MPMDPKAPVRRLLFAASSSDVISGGLRRLSSRGLLPGSIWRRLRVNKRFRVVLKEPDGFDYLSVEADHLGRALYWGGLDAYEEATWRPFLAACRTARGVVDVGANTGLYTLLACAANPAIQVDAFEPVPLIRGRLQANIEANGFAARCRIHADAVSDYTGQGTLHIPEMDGMPLSASLHEDGFRGVPGTHIYPPVVRLDDALAAGSSQIDVMKIDVEVFEDRVLIGAAKILTEFRPSIFIECNPEGPLRRIESILHGHDYVFRQLLPEGPQLKSTIEPDPSERHRNYLMTPAEGRPFEDWRT